MIHQQLTPKLVKKLANYNIVKICPGQNHTAVIDGQFLVYKYSVGTPY
jgi:hypothetical protein